MQDPSALAPIRRLHAHRRWVNDNLRRRVVTLSDDQLDRPFEMGMGSLRATLNHLYAAEHIWLETLLGNPNAPKTTEISFPSLAELLSAWAAQEDRWDAYLRGLTLVDLDRPVTRATVWQGKAMSFTTARLDVLIHVCTHAQYTTAQAINMMRHVGVPAEALPESMMITMSRAGL